MSVDKFLQFMRNASGGQPLHRDDLGDEDSSKSSILGGMSSASVQLAPQLQQQRTREAAPRAAPRAAPPSPGGMGGGMSGAGGGGAIRSGGHTGGTATGRPRRDDDE